MNDFVQIDVSLLYRKIAGTLDSEEEDLFDAWYAESDRHRIYFEWFKRQQEKIACREITRIDSAAALQHIKGKMPVRRNVVSRRALKLAGVAAVIVLGLAVCIFFKTSSEPEPAVSLLVSGKSGTILKLAGGEKIFLDRVGPATLLAGRQVAIRIERGEVHYDATFPSAGREAEYDELIVPAGGEYQLTLGDGTKIFLNSASNLKYPVEFTGGERTVFLEGEAYFKVAHSKEPFFVKTGKGVVRVFGTEFNVMTYPDEPEMQTTLVAGSVGVSVQHGEFQKILPGQQFAVGNTSGTSLIRNVDVLPFVAWKDGLFVSQNDNLEVILRKIARWYDVEFFYRNVNLKEKRFFGIMKKQNRLEDVLNIIAETGDVKFDIKGRTVVVGE